jgi:4-amino-4-deoxy-L-arabinose transferase-like glycosyltransferase
LRVRVARPGRPKPDAFARALIAICLAGFALRVLYVLTFSGHLHFGLDAVWYELVAGTVADGKGVIDPAKFYGHGVAVSTAFRPPLYPVFLAAIAKTIGGTRTTYQLAGCAVGTVTVALIGQLGKRVGGAAVGLTAAALAAVSPALLGIDASVMAETIYVPLVVLTLLAVLRAVERPAAGRWILAGALGGAATLARGDGALVVVFVVLPVAFVSAARRPRARLVATAAALLGALVIVTPWIVRNQVELGRPTLATLDAGTAIAGANCDNTYYGSKIGSWDDVCTQVVGQDAMSELELTDALQRRGVHYATSHAERVPLVVAARIARQWGLWNPMSEARLEAVESRNTRWQVVSWVFDTMMLALAVYAVAVHRRRAAPLPLVLLIGAVTLDAALVYGKQRFQAAAHPAILVIAALAIVTLARHGHRSSDRRRRSARVPSGGS